MVTESTRAGPFKTEGTVLSYMKWSVSVWGWERGSSRYQTDRPQSSDEEGASTIPGWYFQEQEAQMNFHTKCFHTGPKPC